MAHILADRARETSTTTGTGNITLAGAVIGYTTIATVVTTNGDTWPYGVVHETLDEWEVGIATRVSATVFSRSVLRSSNANALVNFSAGPKQVFLTAPADNSYVRIDGDELTGALLAVAANSPGSPAYSFVGDTNTGMYRITADTLGFTAGGTSRLSISTTLIESTLPVSVPSANTPATPALYFGTDVNTGLYQPAADTIGLSTNGTLRLSISTSAIIPTLPISAVSANTPSAPAYSFTGDLNTGMYNSAADALGFSTNSTLRLTISTTAFDVTLPISAVSANTPATPALYFGSDTNTGLYQPAADTIGLSTNSTLRLTIGTAGITSALPILVEGASSTNITMNTASVGNRSLSFQTNASVRWGLETSGDAESGSNVGSNFRIRRYDDAGAAIEYTFHITRATGVVTIGQNGGGSTERLMVQSLGTANTAESVLRINNQSTNTAATTDLVFATGANPGTKRAIIRGHRQGSNGDLSFITDLAGAEVVNLKLTSNGQSAFVAANTPATPAVTFAGDSDTGMYWIGANNIGFAVGGAVGMDLTSTRLQVTGNLTLTASAPTVILDSSATNVASISGRRSGSTRWLLAMPDSIAESGSNAGSRFRIEAFDDAGSSLGNALVIARDTKMLELYGGNDTDPTIYTLSNTSSANEIPFIHMNRGIAGSVGNYITWRMGSGVGNAERVRISGRRITGTAGQLGISLMNSGGTFAERFLFDGTGTLTLGADPTSAMHAVTKQYVDARGITVSDTAPGSPQAGDLWFDSTRLTTFVYYNDGNTSQWVQMIPAFAADQWVRIADVAVTAVGDFSVTWTAGDYRAVKVYMIGVRVASNTALNLYMRIHRGGSVVASAGAYNTTYTYWIAGAGTSTTNSLTVMELTAGGSITEAGQFEILMSHTDAAERPTIWCNSRWTSNTGPAHSSGLMTANVSGGSGLMSGITIGVVGGTPTFAALGRVIVMGMRP